MGSESEQPAQPVAIGWLLASIVAAGFVLLFLVLVLSGRPAFALPGLVALVFLIWFAQQQFTETHRRHYHRWPARWRLWTGSPERREVALAWTRRDGDRVVELSRLLGIGMLVLALVAGIVFITLPHR